MRNARRQQLKDRGLVLFTDRTSVAEPGPSDHAATRRPGFAGSSGSTHAKSPRATCGATPSSSARAMKVSLPNNALPPPAQPQPLTAPAAGWASIRHRPGALG